MGKEKGWFKSGNKMAVGHGRPALPPEIRAERKRNQAALIQLVARLFAMTDDQAIDRRSGPDVTRAEMAVDRLIEKATKDGDPYAFKLLMEIMCGKFPESDWDEFTEEELRVLNRAKEIIEEEKQKAKVIDVNG
jgi:hypothetical protein